MLLKDGADDSHNQLYHIYGVTADQVFTSNGPQAVTINGQKSISHLSFFGNPANVPDGGSALMLLGAALGSVEGVRRFFRKRSA